MTRPTGAAPLPYARRAGMIWGSLIDSSTSTLAAQKHDVISFAMGSPAADAVPRSTLSGIATEVMGTDGTFDYGATEGDPALIRALAGFLASQGQSAAEDRLLITSGGMQGLDLVCKLFVEHGDLVAIESPTYTNGAATIAGYEGSPMEVPTDSDGMQIAKLREGARLVGRTPKVIYVIPTFQNPTGVTLSLDRRYELLELAQAWGSIVIEDDPYRALRFGGDPLPSLEELSSNAPWVIGVHTFSKTIAPGLRVGWVSAHPSVVQLMVDAKQGMDTCTNVLSQRLVERFLARGLMNAHLEDLRSEYRQRKDHMRCVLADALPAAKVTDPQGGFFLWLTLDPSVDTQELFDTALAEGVAYIPGVAFSPSGRFRNALRLCFATNTPERTTEGIARLRRALDRHGAQRLAH